MTCDLRHPVGLDFTIRVSAAIPKHTHFKGVSPHVLVFQDFHPLPPYPGGGRDLRFHWNPEILAFQVGITTCLGVSRFAPSHNPPPPRWGRRSRIRWNPETHTFQGVYTTRFGVSRFPPPSSNGSLPLCKNESQHSWMIHVTHKWVMPHANEWETWLIHVWHDSSIRASWLIHVWRYLLLSMQYAVATTCRLIKTIGLFCRMSSLL